MKRKNSFAIVAIIIMAGALLVLFNGGCSKEEAIEAKVNISSDLLVKVEDGILVFDTYEEMLTTVGKTLRMNDEERKGWEESIGFKSIGTIFDEFYHSIDWEAFNDITEIDAYIERHKDILRLTNNADGELSIEHLHFDNPQRYLISRDELIRVNESVYKFFDNGVVTANIKNLEELKRLKDPELLKGSKNNVNYTPFEHIITKDTAYNCGNFDDKPRYSLCGRDQIYIKIQCHQSYVPEIQSLYARGYYSVRPKRRTWVGVWYWVSRDIEASIKLALDFKNPNTNVWERIFDGQRYPEKNRSEISDEFFQGYISSNKNISVHWGGYDCWATATNVKDKNGDKRVAQVQCNTQLIASHPFPF